MTDQTTLYDDTASCVPPTSYAAKIPATYRRVHLPHAARSTTA
jgi:hypothetical protein